MNRIVDMHCDTLLEGWRHPERSIVNGEYMINLELLKQAGSLCQFFAIWIPRKEVNNGEDAYGLMKSIYAYYQTVLEQHGNLIQPAYTAEDVLKNAGQGKLSSLLCVEDGVFVEGKMERLHEAYDMGVRLITLTWNYENSIGFPNSREPEEHAKGLKPFGLDLVAEMNRLGVIVDVSHLSEGGFWDVVKTSKQPFVASHSCARALCDHPRNLTDAQLKALGEAGGVVGVNFYDAFLQEGLEGATYDILRQHLVYMKDKAGIEALGLGSDFDGIETAGEVKDFGGMPRLLEELQKDFTDDEIDRIASRNAMRIMGEVLK